MGGACSRFGGEERRIQGFGLEGPGINDRIILRWIFKKWDMGVWTGLSWLRIETGGENLGKR